MPSRSILVTVLKIGTFLNSPRYFKIILDFIRSISSLELSFLRICRKYLLISLEIFR